MFVHSHAGRNLISGAESHQCGLVGRNWPFWGNLLAFRPTGQHR